MANIVETFTPAGAMTPIGPYSHIAKAGQMITIGAVAAVDGSTGELAGSDVASQTRHILRALEGMLETVGSDLDHVLHINIFLLDMGDYAEMNAAYAEQMEGRRPARTVVSVSGLPKPGALLTMNLMAIARS